MRPILALDRRPEPFGINGKEPDADVAVNTGPDP